MIYPMHVRFLSALCAPSKSGLFYWRIGVIITFWGTVSIKYLRHIGVSRRKMTAETQTRFDRAESIDASDVELIDQQTCEVQSQSDPDKTYTVDLEDQSCTCPDHVYRGTTCKHLARAADVTGMITL